jgi:hypothetical protein
VLRFLGCIISLVVVALFILGFIVLSMSTPIGFVILILGVVAMIFMGFGFGMNLLREHSKRRKG